MYTITIDDKNLMDFGYAMLRRPEVPAPAREFSTFKVLGTDGNYYVDRGTYSDVSLKVVMFYFSEEEDRADNFSMIKSEIANAKGKKLFFSEFGQWYFKIKTVKLSGSKMSGSIYNEFTVEFICDPFMYKDVDDITSTGTVNNPYFNSRPVYEITGEGQCTLTVNGNDMIANVSGTLVIDTDLKIAYRDGSMMPNSVKGYYDDMMLLSGDNTVSITSGFSLKIKPNWRRL